MSPPVKVVKDELKEVIPLRMTYPFPGLTHNPKPPSFHIEVTLHIIGIDM